MARAMQPTEAQEMRVLAQWLDLAGVLWLHPPNETRGPVQHYVQRAKVGVKSGAPDVLVFTAPPWTPGVRGAAVELKRARGGVVSDTQEDWLRRLTAERWLTHVAHGADDAIRWLMGLGYGQHSKPKRET